MYLLQPLLNWHREVWDITLGVWKSMNNYYPVVVTHPVNKVLKAKATKTNKYWLRVCFSVAHKPTCATGNNMSSPIRGSWALC